MCSAICAFRTVDSSSGGVDPRLERVERRGGTMGIGGRAAGLVAVLGLAGALVVTLTGRTPPAPAVSDRLVPREGAWWDS